MFCELTHPDINLAATTHSTSSTHRVDINAKLTCSLQKIRPYFHLTLTARGCENDFKIAII
jgi:hypothetical protein